VLEVTEVSGACSEGLPLRVKELMAHLDRYHEFQVNSKVKMHFLICVVENQIWKNSIRYGCNNRTVRKQLNLPKKKGTNED
jgi:hypothetical protein